MALGHHFNPLLYTHDFPDYLLSDACEVHPLRSWSLIDEIRNAARTNKSLASVFLYEKVVLHIINACKKNNEQLKLSIFKDSSIPATQKTRVCIPSIATQVWSQT